MLCRLLLDMQSPEFLVALPMGPEAFKTWQADCIDRVKGSLWTNWLPKCTESFRRVPPVFINGDREAYYRCVATLQVRLLCMLDLPAVCCSCRWCMPGMQQLHALHQPRCRSAYI